MAVEPARLKPHVRFLSDPSFPRNYVHTENLDRAAAYIRNQLEEAKGEVSYQSYEMKGKTYRNVIALFGPDTEERIVVGAHYDAFGELPGADDNASGVAGLIELAFLLGSTSLPIRVELVGFTLEEPLGPEEPGNFRTQYGGSAVHATSLRKRGIPVRVMFSLEMIGFFSDAENSQSYPLSFLKMFYPSKGNFILVVESSIRYLRFTASRKQCEGLRPYRSIQSMPQPLSKGSIGQTIIIIGRRDTRR